VRVARWQLLTHTFELENLRGGRFTVAAIEGVLEGTGVSMPLALSREGYTCWPKPKA
jgi:hypothetical protein